ncbi:uncharacterized protein LOC118756266 [Rhagoletis pomonella]|uniref:uncharacterized protein LOC118756266 n=1 Tax=Rhagoletis pomonella TaxID=28610 RepID=UPI00177BDAB1|nr:uncharacterized protein LOC118756266 [Rhagoletis pomonella]
MKIINSLASIDLATMFEAGIVTLPDIRERQLWKLDRSGTFWERDVPLMDENRFKENFRLNRNAFRRICEKVRGIEKANTHMSHLNFPLVNQTGLKNKKSKLRAIGKEYHADERCPSHTRRALKLETLLCMQRMCQTLKRHAQTTQRL